jgi:hypothetical protein
MEELDLHGLYHFDVPLEVENFLYLNSTNLPIKIITGKSDKMKEIVIEVLEKNKFTYDIPPHNFGVIVVLG